MRQRWGAGHDDACPLPRSLTLEEGHLVCHPLLPERGCLLWTAVPAKGKVPSDAATLGLREIRLHPDDRIQQVRQLAPGGTDSLDDDQVKPRRDLDRPWPTVRLPRGRPVVDGVTEAHGLEHAAGEQLVPGEERMLPGEVVGMDHCRCGHRAAQASRQRGLASGAAPVDRDHGRPTRQRASAGEHDAREFVDRRHPPRPSDRLDGKERHHHLRILPDCSPAHAQRGDRRARSTANMGRNGVDALSAGCGGTQFVKARGCRAQTVEPEACAFRAIRGSGREGQLQRALQQTLAQVDLGAELRRYDGAGLVERLTLYPPLKPVIRDDQLACFPGDVASDQAALSTSSQGPVGVALQGRNIVEDVAERLQLVHRRSFLGVICRSPEHPLASFP